MIAAETAVWDMSIIWPYGKKKENSQIFNDDFYVPFSFWKLKLDSHVCNQAALFI
jgi:hypothetical protein